MKQATALSLALAWLCAGLPPCFANGGGYTSGGKYESVIPFEMKDIASIAMETEDLRIEVGPVSANIHVRYTMRNVTKRTVTCQFGFPVEAYDRIDDITKSYKAQARGSAIPFKCLKKKDASKDNVVMSPFNKTSVPYWMVSELTAAPGEAFELSISMKAPHYIDSVSISDNWSEETLMFYRFSSAAVWNGPIKKGHVEIIPQGIDPAGMKALAPANRFTRRKSDGALVWDFTDLEPTLDDDVKLQVIPGIEGRSSTVKPGGNSYQDSVNYVLHYGDKWVRGVPITAWTMRTSHTSARSVTHYYRNNEVTRPFDVEQLPLRRRYQMHDDVWGTDAPGHGVGQSVTLEFKKAVSLGLVKLNNTWKNGEYGKVTRIKAVVNGKWSREFDMEGYTYLPMFDAPKAKTLQLVIMKAEPGTKFPETCLSDLQVFSQLSSKPKIDPCR